MATLGASANVPIGSSQWIQNENDQLSQFLSQEIEDFGFAARNEVEWLNEHMADIFTKNQVNVTEIFKTPGKLRGKTPRTARKHNPLEIRQPLSDVFSTNIRQNLSPSPKKAQDAGIKKSPSRALAPNDASRQVQKKNVDSGYHGGSSDEMDLDEGYRKDHTAAPLINHAHRLLHRESPARRQSTPASSKDDTAIEGSFHSAREEVRDRTESVAPIEPQPVSTDVRKSTAEVEPASQEKPMGSQEIEEQNNDIEVDSHEDSQSSSEASSPAKTLARKSSLTFATLPAPEPWTTKKSMGAATGIGRGSFLGRATGGKSLGGLKQREHASQKADIEHSDGELEDGHDEKPALEREESENSNIRRMHNKSSTQTLQDKINALGKSQGPRPTKSIPNLIAAAVTYPDLQRPESPHQKEQDKAGVTRIPPESHKIADEDSWILPTDQKSQRRLRPSMLQSTEGEAKIVESAKCAVIQVETQHADKSPSMEIFEQQVRADRHQTNPEETKLEYANQTEGPLSASKSKLQSIMKSARGLFSSSAGISAQAKMEALDSPAARTRGKASADEDRADTNAQIQQMSTITKEMTTLAQDIDKMARSRPTSPVKNEGRRTRSSTEKEQKRKQQETEALEAAPEKAARQSPSKIQRFGKFEEAEAQGNIGSETAKLPTSKPIPTSAPSTQLQRPKAGQRPTKPTKEPAQKSKPAPVNIKIGLPSSWRGLPNSSTLSTSLQDCSQPGPSKVGGLAKKPNNASIQTISSSNSVRGPAHGAVSKPKALLAAERKKEQDEREAQRKQEAKREMERKRVAQQEEARQHEFERQREQERLAAMHDPKKTTIGKQVIEKRRLDLKNNQQRGAPQEKAPVPRFKPETHESRPPSRMEPARPGTSHAPPNPSRMGIKRVADQEPEEESRPIRVPAGPAYTANEAKRRRTDDEEDFRETGIRPSMQPPKRVSTAQKNHFKPSLFPSNNYTTAPPPAAHHQPPNNPLKNTILNPAYPTLPTIQSQPSRPPPAHDISKYATTKPPFAENPNPPAAAAAPPPSIIPFKTPTNNNPHSKHPYPPSSSCALKTASPMHHHSYPNGENVHLADIPTDSDSSPDTAQKAHKRSLLPSWALSPAINDALERQEAQLDADAVFGPVATPKLEEMFRGGRAGQGGFRARTSSANWKESGDSLTVEEVRRDREARERMRREGGWRFGLG